MTNHPLISTLKSLRGNVRGCVLTEPLWGIPFNLYAPYVSVYMLSLGLADSQIGLLTSISLLLQVFWTAVSGAITDKFGRKRTTLVSDLISWSIPCLIWAAAQDFNYFLAAVIFNSIWRVSANSWTCLLVEDTDPKLLIDVYSLIYIAGLVAAFVSPVTGVLIDQFSLVPTMRGLYLLSFVMMTAKFLIMNNMVTETQRGVARMEETRHQPWLGMLREYPQVLRQILRMPATVFAAVLMILLNIVWTVKGTFWSILVTETLLIPAEHLVIFTFARSIVMLVFYFTVMPRLNSIDMRAPLIWGMLGLTVSQVFLIAAPPGNYAILLAVTALEAFATPAATTLVDKLVITAIDPKERARILAILYVVMIVLTSPFGWIAGQLSEWNRILPFLLMIALLCAGVALLFLSNRLVRGGLEYPADQTVAEPAGLPATE